MSNATQEWMTKLNDYPGWKEWKRKQIVHTLSFNEPMLSESVLEDFSFSQAIEKEHAVVFQYIGLLESLSLLRECEYYFRRYPFRGLPITRHSHITNICEMYFNRFYEFRERLKKYFQAIKDLTSESDPELGKFIKIFDKEFDQELRARNLVNHHRRFADIAIDQVYLTAVAREIGVDEVLSRKHLAAYRHAVNEWAKRVRRRGAKVEEFMEAIAGATLAKCSFLASIGERATPSRSA